MRDMKKPHTRCRIPHICYEANKEFRNTEAASDNISTGENASSWVYKGMRIERETMYNEK